MLEDNDHENDGVLYTVPIPKIFHSFELDAPFEKCSACEAPLLGTGTPYFIEKAYKANEVIFEYAMCDECREGMGKEMSDESKANIELFFMENINMIERFGTLFHSFDNSIKPWLDRCVITGKQRSECEGFQICAQCENDQIIVALAPMMVSSEATEQIQKLLSKKTREGFDGFVKDTLNPPVDFQDVPMLL